MSFFVDGSLSMITEGASDNKSGIPALAWVEMGLDGNREIGWYDGYNTNLYFDNHFDQEAMQEECINDLRNTIVKKMQNPLESFELMRKKIASMWCEPSFEGFLFNGVANAGSFLRFRSSFLVDVFSCTGRLHRILYAFLDIYQSLIYFGTILFIINKNREKTVSDMIGILIFIGGFLFHVFWEAKSSYAFPYIVILIPYAVMGLRDLIEGKMPVAIAWKKAGIRTSAKICLLGMCILMTGSVLLVSDMFIIRDDEEALSNWRREHLFVSEGYYYLQPIDDKNLYIGGSMSDNDGYLTIFRASDNNSKLFIERDGDQYWEYQFYDMDKKSRLTVIGDAETCMISENNIDFPSDAYWHWRIEKEGGGYCIRWWNDMNKVLTFDVDNKTVCLTDYENGNSNQIWRIRRK